MPKIHPSPPIHTLLPSLVGRTLRVDLVGVGGNGCQMLTGLARMNIALQALGHPGLDVHAYDPDTVSDANMGRQLFSHGDLGLNKATVLINRINLFFGLQWQANPNRYASGSPDILIGCVDTIASRKQLARSQYTYWLDLGNRDHTGQVVLGLHKCRRKSINPSIHPSNPLTFFELFPHLKRTRKEDNTPSCSLAGALESQDLFINQAVSTFALQMLWSLLRHGSVTSNGCYINLQTGNTRPIPLPQ